MKPWAERFYNSDAWRSCRDSFLKSKGYLCERCSTPDDPVTAKIAHHKTYLTKRGVYAIIIHGSLVKRLRRRPLTAETRVRFSYGLF